MVWRGDFETGDYSQYTGGRQETGDDPDVPSGGDPKDPKRRLAIIESPVKQGRYALKVTVKKGDINNSGTRNELVTKTNEPTGSEYYYRWQVMFDAAYPIVDMWQLFAQWHHSGNDHSPPLSFNLRGEDITLQHNSDPYVADQEYNTVKLGKLQRGIWNDFIVRIKWSPDPQVGFIEVHMNCKLVMPRKYISTQYTGQLNHLKVGLYRDSRIEPDAVLIHDGWVMGKALADVQAPGEDCAK